MIRENIYSYHKGKCKGIFRALRLKEVSKYIQDKNQALKLNLSLKQTKTFRAIREVKV